MTNHAHACTPVGAVPPTAERFTAELITLVRDTDARHLFTQDGERKIMIASLRYLDTYAKIDGTWYFAERKLLLDWSETRPSPPGS